MYSTVVPVSLQWIYTSWGWIIFLRILHKLALLTSLGSAFQTLAAELISSRALLSQFTLKFLLMLGYAPISFNTVREELLSETEFSRKNLSHKWLHLLLVDQYIQFFSFEFGASLFLSSSPVLLPSRNDSVSES